MLTSSQHMRRLGDRHTLALHARAEFAEQDAAAARAIVARLEADVLDARAREARALQALARQLERISDIRAQAARAVVRTADPFAQLALGSIAALAEHEPSG